MASRKRHSRRKRIEQSLEFWQTHIKALQENQLVPEAAIRLLVELVLSGNIGPEEGQIPPSHSGQWAVYETLLQFPKLTPATRLLLAGIPAGEAAIFEEHLALQDGAFDPSIPEEAREAKRIQRMNDAEVEHLLNGIE